MSRNIHGFLENRAVRHILKWGCLLFIDYQSLNPSFQSANHNARTDRPQLPQLPPITKAFPCNLKYCQYSHHDIPSPKSFPVIINSRSIFRESCQKVNLNPLRLSTQTSWISVMKKKAFAVPSSQSRQNYFLIDDGCC